ncbi:hypothetical protein RJ640_023346 [Escallonia rubra]|uniref:t-SNARE coiled-coil homology domain-containing protein n=1 Tax=Escallonia rubra TaxID=112253 RepID=A0AA88RID2_9ASTE|nr:hypothetical protein RJ640_023346 [Escallonia rubra]
MDHKAIKRQLLTDRNSTKELHVSDWASTRPLSKLRDSPIRVELFCAASTWETARGLLTGDELIIYRDAKHMVIGVSFAKVAKRSSIFDDPLKEIQELTALINNDISTLNLAVSDLQTLKNLEIADGIHSEDRVVHSTAVFDDLNRKLMGTAKEFHDVLNTRTENIKAHEQRKQIFSTNMSRENPLRQHVKTVTEPPPWSSSSNSSESLQPSESSGSGVQSNQLRRRLAPDNSPSHHMEVSMLQQVVPRQESYSQSRAFALQNVESTISELGGIFTHLATMVAQQGELAIRIDDNMEESLANVEGARSALLRHLNQISSNRSLLIKIFAILIFFLIVFIFFLA